MGKSVVKELAQWFSAQNLWGMTQFFEIYNGNEKLSALLRELSWNKLISRALLKQKMHEWTALIGARNAEGVAMMICKASKRGGQFVPLLDR